MPSEIKKPGAIAKVTILIEHVYGRKYRGSWNNF